MEKYKKSMIIDVLEAIFYNALAICCVLIREWELAVIVTFFAGMTFAEAREKVDTYFMAKKIFEQAKELEEEKEDERPEEDR